MGIMYFEYCKILMEMVITEDNFTKFIGDLLLRYPEPIEFVKQVNSIFDNMRFRNEAKLNHVFAIGEYLYNIFKFIHAITIFENCVSLINPNIHDSALLKIRLYSFIYIGISYHRLGDYSKAINYYDLVFEIRREDG